VPYVESDPTAPLSVYGRTKLDAEAEVRDGWIVRTAWLYGEEGSNFVKTMLRLGRERDEVRVVSDQVGSPTYTGHLAAAIPALLGRPYGIWHVVNAGKCSRAELAEAIFEEAGIGCRVVPIPAAELSAPAARPAYSVLASERADPVLLPHWREGLRECVANLG
jgi:dTDP-4-dehydrorhamnose reductase